MAPMGVVPAFQPGEDRHAGLGPALEASPVDDFPLQCRKEALGHRVIVGVSRGSHGGHDAGLAATFAKRVAGVLAAAVRMMDDRLRAPLCERHLQRIEHERRSEVMSHGPADDASGPHIQHDGVDYPT